MATYAGAKQRSPTSPAAVRVSTAPRPLSDAERAKVAENKAFVETNLPDLIPFIKELHAEGMIDGWRAVQNCELLKRNDHGNSD